MPQASNWEDLYKFEDAHESAAQSILTAQGLTAYIQRNEGEIVTPSVGVQFTVGPALERYGFRASDGAGPFLDLWSARLTFAVTTQRGKNNSQHDSLRAKIRYRMQDLSLWNTTRLPFHQVAKILEAGTSIQVLDDKDRDISEINFNVIFAIRHDAWPAA
jgi:hypothetical protein